MRGKNARAPASSSVRHKAIKEPEMSNQDKKSNPNIAPLILRSVQKVIALLIGGGFGYLGYKLVVMGTTGVFDLSGGIAGFKGKLISASPGMIFILLGAIIVISVVRTIETYKTVDKNRHTESAGCWVATAYYADGNHTDVVALRNLRDNLISQGIFSGVYQLLTRTYYRIGQTAFGTWWKTGVMKKTHRINFRRVVTMVLIKCCLFFAKRTSGDMSNKALKRDSA